MTALSAFVALAMSSVGPLEQGETVVLGARVMRPFIPLRFIIHPDCRSNVAVHGCWLVERDPAPPETVHWLREEVEDLAPAQRDGRACIRCGDTEGGMLPAGTFDGVALHRHRQCEEFSRVLPGRGPWTGERFASEHRGEHFHPWRLEMNAPLVAGDEIAIKITVSVPMTFHGVVMGVRT